MTENRTETEPTESYAVRDINIDDAFDFYRQVYHVATGRQVMLTKNQQTADNVAKELNQARMEASRDTWQTVRSMITILMNAETDWNRVFMCDYIITEIEKACPELIPPVPPAPPPDTSR